MLLSDSEIRKLALEEQMIVPYTDGQVIPGVISYGISSYGYDLRAGPIWKVFDSFLLMHGGCIDPKSKDWHKCFSNYKVEYGSTDTGENYVLIPPNSFALGESLETIKVPRNILCICLGKSTFARCGIIVNVTPLEPMWIGKVTIEISNTTPLPARVYIGEGICQVLFLQAAVPCERSYADKKGRYQNQTGLTMPSVL